MCVNQTQQKYGHLYLGGMWLGVDLRIATKMTCAQNMLTVLGSIVNMIRGGGMYNH